MAQAFIDQVTMETIGKTAGFTQAQVGVVVMEVLGYFKWGTVDIDEIVTEVVGTTPDFTMIYMDSFLAEVIGQWAGF